MDFELSSDQEDLKDAVRKICAGSFPIERVREGFGRDDWKDLVDAGVFAIRLPEDRGGVGLGTAEAVLVFEELGRALVPGPLLGTSLAAGTVEGSESASTVVGVVEERAGVVVVEHLDALDVLVVVGDAGLRRVDPKGLDAVAVERPLDPLTPVHRLQAPLPAGDSIGGPADAAAWGTAGAALAAALQLGSAEATLDMAVAYAKERRQFDKPIGAFQAVKHILADMLVRVELARAAVYAAGVTIDDPEVGDASRAAAAAKVLADEAAVANGKACIQVHGGMGFTWEVDAHLHLKRAWVLETTFGSPDHHAEALAAFV